MLRKIFRLTGVLLKLPYLAVFRWSSASAIIEQDVHRWATAFGFGAASVNWRFMLIFAKMPEFRNLFYHRSKLPRPLQFFAPARGDLFIICDDVGEGLLIQHGFATILLAESVGRNCWINQQVTVGASERPGRPRIGHDVRIAAGAKILGPVSIGDHVIVGANAVVTKDVPPNCTVVGVPARIIRRDGRRVDEAL